MTNPHSDSTLPRVADRLKHLKSKLNIENLRLFAIDLEGFLKAQTKKFKRIDAEDISAHTRNIEAVQHILNDFRNILRARHLEGGQLDDFRRGSVDHDLLLLNEYVSHVYVQYLVQAYYNCRISSQASSVLPLIERGLKDEARIREAYGYLLEQRHGPNSSNLEDIYLRRVSLLKKYFQRTLFVKVKGEPYRSTLLIPVYGLAAALAASFAIMVTIYQTQNLIERVGINSIAFISLGVVAYVIKDLMKDYFRRYFYKKSSYFFPDYKKKLWLDKAGKKVPLGKIREYLRPIDSRKISPELAELRYSVPGGELEAYLNEDVLHFRKTVSLNLHSLESRRDYPWGLREIIRYRFDRLLTSMEDPFKNMQLISESGIPASRQGHRIYHVYLAVKIEHRKSNSSEEAMIQPAFKAFRVTLDKNGVLDCREVHWVEDTTQIPPIP